MDPLSVTASAAALITICFKAVQAIKSVIERLRKAKAFLTVLLSQTEKVRLYLEQLRGLSKQLGPRSGILLAFDDSGPKTTIEELHAFALKMAHNPSWVQVRVLLSQSTADKLLARLQRHENEISQVLISITAESTIRTEDEIRKLQDGILLHSQVMSPFSSRAPTLLEELEEPPQPPTTTAKETDAIASNEYKASLQNHAELPDSGDISQHTQPTTADLKIGDSDTDDEDSVPVLRGYIAEESEAPRIWFGDLSRNGFNQTYLSQRDRLSDSAYYGNFDSVFSLLSEANRTYQLSWANAPRLSSNPQKSSGWTLLHQAVFVGASCEQIERLVEFGALRLLRTTWTDENELPYRNMTAIEMARELGYTQLLDTLAPTIYHCLPNHVLETLQNHFHYLIKIQLHSWPHEYATIRLPELSVLTELKMPLMWFPLKSRVARVPRGFMYRLDGRELLVKAFQIHAEGRDEVFRITEDGVNNIQQAITFSA